MSNLTPNQSSFGSPRKIHEQSSEISTIWHTPSKFMSNCSQDSFAIKKNNIYFAQTTTQSEIKIKSELKFKKIQSIKKKQRIRYILGRIIFNKQLTYKNVFKKLKSLISKESSHVPPSTNNAQSRIAQSLVWKTKFNLQTSLIRSALQLQIKFKSLTNKNQQSLSMIQPQSNLKIENQTNIMICPDQLFSLRIRQRQTILKLIPYAQLKIRVIIRKFERNVEYQKIKDSYCQRMYNSARSRCRVFIEKLRLIVKLDKQLVLSTKRKIMSDVLNKCLNRRDKVFYENLKNHKLLSQMKKKQVILKMRKNSQLKILQTLNLWYRNVQLKKKTKAERVLSIQKIQSLSIQSTIQENPHLPSIRNKQSPQQQQKKKDIFKKIIMKRHVQKWLYHARFRRNLQFSAIKLACASRISIQRSFWRLNINAYHNK